ncbi:MAG: arginine--tRNA ligase [Pseudomonadota bacterium]
MTLLDALSAVVGEAFAAEGLDAAFGAVRPSDRPDLAQFQCNGALAAAKQQKTNPRAIGEAVAKRLAALDLFADVGLAGPGFLNLTVTDAALSDRLRALAGQADVGAWRSASPESVVMDYGGPNVAKPLHVGHLRSAIIGEALKRLFRAAGDAVVADVHLGDWGLQMGQLISELELRRPDLPYFASPPAGPFPDEPPVTLSELEELYPAASAACKADPDRADRARKATKALQDGHAGYRALWRGFVDLSVASMRANYDDLGVSFDLWKGESDADPLIADLLEDLQTKGLLEVSDGAQIVRVARDGDKKDVPPAMIVNSEGAVGYHATDVATIVDRSRTIAPDRMLYVVDNRQALHFEQVFRVAAAAGYCAEDRLEHLGFGTMQGTDGKPFKTREGGVLKLRDLIDLVTARADERLAQNGLAADLDADARAATARAVGVAALKFADLSNQRTTDYVFDLDRFLAFEGKTGPYLLYAGVRVRSVLRKADARGATHDVADLSVATPAERDLALVLLAYPEAMRQAHAKRAPHHLCDHAYTLAQAFSKFYAADRIVDEADEPRRRARLALTQTAGRQLDHCLDLLGIARPERM